MKIDRHNYEEYFLLYMDSELNVDQKKQVDRFIKENPDLEEEWAMLHQSRLIPDIIVFENKNLLMKEENDSFINLNNYTEWLVLYVDNELNAEERLIIEKFVATHSHIQQELALLQQTKLQPEKIVFADKKVLYKKEKPRVISMQWWRVAVAAILILAAGIALYSVLINKNVNKNEGYVRTQSKKMQSPNGVNPTPDKQEQTNPPVQKGKEQIPVINRIQEPKKQRQQSLDGLALQEEQKANIDIPKKSDIIAINSSDNVTEAKIKNVITFKPQQIFKDSIVTKGSSETPQPIYVINTENESKKFRGFFRKATRLFERTTNIKPANDDNKVLIGGMAINLK